MTKAEITFDLIMDNNMDFVEGCYRLDTGAWQVFVVSKEEDSEAIEVSKGLVWDSGVIGLNAFVPLRTRLNRDSIKRILSEELGVTEWTEVSGPDSIQIR